MCHCPDAAAVDDGGVETGLRLMSDALPGKPDGTLCEAARKDGGGATTAAAAPAAGVGDCDGVVEGLEKGDPKTEGGFTRSPRFDTTGADVDAPKGEKDVFAFSEFRRVDGTSVEPEAPGTEEFDPKAEVEFWPNTEEELPLAPAPAPKPQFPKTFGLVLRFANAEASGGTGAGADGVVVAASGAAGMGDPKAETGAGAGAGDVPKTEVDDELAPSMAEGEGLTPKLLVSHSVALGFSGWGWC